MSAVSVLSMPSVPMPIMLAGCLAVLLIGLAAGIALVSALAGNRGSGRSNNGMGSADPNGRAPNSYAAIGDDANYSGLNGEWGMTDAQAASAHFGSGAPDVGATGALGGSGDTTGNDGGGFGLGGGNADAGDGNGGGDGGGSDGGGDDD